MNATEVFALEHLQHQRRLGIGMHGQFLLQRATVDILWCNRNSPDTNVVGHHTMEMVISHVVGPIVFGINLTARQSERSILNGSGTLDGFHGGNRRKITLHLFIDIAISELIAIETIHQTGFFQIRIVSYTLGNDIAINAVDTLADDIALLPLDVLRHLVGVQNLYIVITLAHHLNLRGFQLTIVWLVTAEVDGALLAEEVLVMVETPYNLSLGIDCNLQCTIRQHGRVVAVNRNPHLLCHNLYSHQHEKEGYYMKSFHPVLLFKQFIVFYGTEQETPRTIVLEVGSLVVGDRLAVSRTGTRTLYEAKESVSMDTL